MPFLIAVAIWIGLCCNLSAQAQEQAEFNSRWYLGPVYQMDSLTLPGVSSSTTDQLFGLQGFHRLNPYFGSSGSLFFIPEDSSIAFQLNTRWIWPLPFIEPYAGANLHYLSRDGGGLSLVFQPGLLIQFEKTPVLIDIYALARYDLITAVFNNQYAPAARFGFGATFMFELPE